MSEGATGSGLGGASSRPATGGSTGRGVAGGVDASAGAARLPNGGASLLGRLYAGTLPLHPHTDDATGGVIDYLRTQWGTDHLAAADPHTQYLTVADLPPAGISQADADLRYLRLTGGTLSGSANTTLEVRAAGSTVGTRYGQVVPGARLDLTVNASHDGTNWNRDDVSKGSVVLGANEAIPFSVANAPAGANPVGAAYRTLLSLNQGATLTLGETTLPGTLALAGNAATTRALVFQTGASPRWEWRTTNTAESGSNNGSNLDLIASTDAGAALRTAISIVRATGVISLAAGSGQANLQTASGTLRLRGATDIVLDPATGSVDSPSNNTKNLGRATNQWGAGHLGFVSLSGDGTLSPVVAAAGAVRLRNGATGTLAWRNAGNTADLTLGVDASNTLATTAPLVVQSKPVAVSPTAGNALTWDATGLWAPAGGGGDSTTTDAAAARPAASNDGNLFLPSDGYLLERDTGSAWAPWGPLFPLTPPVLGDFAWVNQGTATATTEAGGVTLSAPTAAADNLRGLVKAAPAPPYTITAAFLPNVPVFNYACIGLAWRNSTSGQFVFGYQAAVVQVSHYTSPTALGSNPLANAPLLHAAPLLWVRIADNGTTRSFALSRDGRHFVTYYSASRTALITPDQVGVFWQSGGNPYEMYPIWLSWKQS